MSEKIEKTLKKIGNAISKENSTNSSKTDSNLSSLGDPDCPECAGLGYIRYEVPVDHPEFGRLHICSCRQNSINQGIQQRLFSLSNLDQLSHLTFENFKPRGRVGLSPRQADSLEIAFETTRRYSQSLPGWLVLQGGYGCGKTHLAAAIANFVVSLGVPCLFLTVPDLLDSLRFAYGGIETSFEERFEEIRSSTLLILDDFGTQNATSWAQEKLFQIINYRYINRLPLVITTNIPLRDIEGRIRSRIEDPDLVEMVKINAPDFRNPTQDFGYHELSSLTLLHDRTFANFDLRKSEGLEREQIRSLEIALEATQEFSQHPNGWLLIMGTYGSGKTHLAAAIANYRAELGEKPLFVVVSDLLDHLRATFSPDSQISLDRRFDDVKTTPMLILDDLGSQSMTPWVREKIYQLLDHRYNAALPTVITTVEELEKFDPRIRTRILDRRLCKTYGLKVPSYTEVPRSSASRRTGTKKSNN